MQKDPCVLRNLKKMALMNRDTDVENRLADTAGEGEGGVSWESGAAVCIAMG